jgi:hypothetical protein
MMGVILLLTSFVLIVGAGWTAYRKYKRLEKYTPVEGLVLHSRIANEPHGRVFSNYRLHYTVQYEVGGRTLVTSAQSDYTTSSAAQLAAWSRFFVPGQRRSIRYNPDQPTEITTDAFDLESFRHEVWLGCWALGIFVAGILLRKI